MARVASRASPPGSGGRGSAERRVRAQFEATGYVRAKNSRKQRRRGSESYKKGWEVRIVVDDAEELRELRRCLADVGLRAGQPFVKGARICQPVYGKFAVEWFLNP